MKKIQPGGFKCAFNEFLTDRKREAQCTIEIQNLYAAHKKNFQEKINELRKKDPETAEVLENAFDYCIYKLAYDTYDYGFRDGIEFQNIAQPQEDIDIYEG